MTTRTKRTAKPRPIEALIGGDRELLKGLVKEALHEVLEAEMTEALGAGLGERTADRTGYRSGYYSRGLVTRIGKLELRVPRDREGRFSTELFDRYQRSEKALVSAPAEMYVQGVSTRKVKAVTEELCGHTFSASTVSRITGAWMGTERICHLAQYDLAKCAALAPFDCSRISLKTRTRTRTVARGRATAYRGTQANKRRKCGPVSEKYPENSGSSRSHVSAG